MNFCAGTKKSGAPCGGKPLDGSAFCTFHDPAKAKVVAAGRKQGGHEVTKKPEPLNLPEMSLDTAKDVVAIARDTINRVRKGEFNPKQGTAIGSLLSAALQGMKRVEESKDEETKGGRPLKDVEAKRLEELARGGINAEH